MTRLVSLAAVTLVALHAAPRLGAQVIDTRTGGFDSQVYGGSGLFGQTFRVPPGAGPLAGFSFWVRSVYATEGYSFRALVYAWDGAGATGGPLYASEVRAVGAGAPLGEEAFAVGGLPLAPGADYLALVQRDGPGFLGVGFRGFAQDLYADGLFVSGAPYGDPAAAAWRRDILTPGSDLTFVARFGPATVVPEPGTGALVAAALAGLAATGRRRRSLARAAAARRAGA